MRIGRRSGSLGCSLGMVLSTRRRHAGWLIGVAVLLAVVGGPAAPVLSQDQAEVACEAGDQRPECQGSSAEVFACYRNAGERLLRIIDPSQECAEYETFVRLSPGEQGPQGPPGDGATAVATRWYRDDDGDGHGDWYRFIDSPAAPKGFVGGHTDCDDLDPSSHEGAEGDEPGKDNNCNEHRRERGVDPETGEERWEYTGHVDCDGDGRWSWQSGGDDCQDLNASIFPGHDEVRNDGLDNDCDPGTPDHGYYRPRKFDVFVAVEAPPGLLF